jgi:hypothetical protein
MRAPSDLLEIAPHPLEAARAVRAVPRPVVHVAAAVERDLSEPLVDGRTLVAASNAASRVVAVGS